jgi:hypothetical protein
MRTISLAELREEMVAAGDALAGALEAAARETVAEIVTDEGDEMGEAEGRVIEERPTPPRAAPARSAAARTSRSAGAPASGSSASESRRRELPSAPVASSPPAVDSPTAAEPGADAERRAQRRRGRRGGRRNRPSGGTPLPAPDGSSNADETSTGE